MIDNTEGRLATELEYAKSINNSTLQNCIDRLEKSCSQYKPAAVVEIYPDSAPHSFYFVRKHEGVFAGNGGIIYYEKNDSGVGAPQFSVSIGNNLNTRWEIHT